MRGPAAAADQPAVFEQPLNERMRTFLRLDFLYNQALFHNEKSSPWGSRSAICAAARVVALVESEVGTSASVPLA